MRFPLLAIPLKPVRSTALQRDHESSSHFNKPEYDEYIDECLSWNDRDRDSESFEECEVYQHLNVVEKGEVRLKPFFAGKSSGVYGRVYATDDPGLVVQVSRKVALCSELALLRTMNGLGGIVPGCICSTIRSLEHPRNVGRGCSSWTLQGKRHGTTCIFGVPEFP